MSQYIVTQNIDYLSFSVHLPLDPFGDKKYDNIKSPNSHYDNCIQLQSGALHLWHSTNTTMKHHYVYAGQPLEYLRQNGQNEKEMVQWCLERSNITRIDLALTSQPSDLGHTHAFTPQHVAWAVRDEMLVSRLKPAKDVTDNMKAQTKYIGNRKTRARLFRAYDKGADNGELANILIRYELETRKGAKTIARAVTKGDNYASIIRRYVDFPTVRAWLDITNTKPTNMQHSTPVLSAHELELQKSNSRWAWLQNSIPRTVEKALQEDYDKFGIYPDENEHFQLFLSSIVHKMTAITNKLDEP